MGNWNLLRKRTPSRIYRLRELSKTVVLIKNGTRPWMRILFKLKKIIVVVLGVGVPRLLMKNFEKREYLRDWLNMDS
jgi:hypothetical protein